jgi:hypothetical protein
MANKVTPTKKGDVKFAHNLYDVLGKTLYEGIRSGRLDPRKLENISANIGMDLGSGYGADLGYNQYIGDRKQDLKLTLTKKF